VKWKTVERMCNKSQRMSFGAYGQDGKGIITTATFGCNGYEKAIT
jgi:hypothetical protein